MRRLLAVGLIVTCVGCGPPEKAIEERKAAVPVEVVPEVEPPQSPEEMKALAEERAAAKQMALDLGVVVEENESGVVVLLDTAAQRSGVDDGQMLEILVFQDTLTWLTLEGPSITDVVAPRIAEHTRLVTLVLKDTFISDAGLAQWDTLRSLKVIDIRLSSLVTDEGMASLARLPELKAVRISGTTGVTDAGIASLLALPHLAELDLRNCRGVTAEGLKLLEGKDTLRTLKIGGLAIDDDALVQLRLALPECEIQVD